MSAFTYYQVLKEFAEAQSPSWRVGLLFTWAARRYAAKHAADGALYEKQVVDATLVAGRHEAICECGEVGQVRKGTDRVFHVGEARSRCAGLRIRQSQTA